MDTIHDIDLLVADGHIEEAVERLTKMIEENPGDDTLFFTRGKLRWRLDDRSGATSDYVKASAINPSSPAVRALEQARDVADFFNPDMYNP
ncbi:MAG: hypothetical protein NC039_07195 [Muribaculaceae bacterium]|nr:hypothetical protein [Muribaculaceae bacterium]